ncbi:hypothetical protein J3P71_19045 [Rhizobium leguminosarum]|uniref:hypothetical protein n=1 Tax=Rhizobium leguminosarum TaxID=384 RepID=UPI00103D1DFC|nr:hypothetical protein [Rhizobium leguminosarum]MBY5840393.1 hypothetical protein [Rhizobium leguminosarum]NKM80141.1 hypothetical protein [Rhizobium leguminosarum bv. viciae]QSZ06956.1 hypothetical protein J3P71_19045 [Rhizobium leguminosarum]TBZ77051.1 hypothetical protein E0H43_07050 [Rhizobium leguminosarum bv. viciae]
MKLPVLRTPMINPLIESTFQQIADHWDEQRRIREEMGHSEVEREVLEEALQAARDIPGAEREVWDWMSSAIKEVNLSLASMDAPPLRCVSHETFLAFLRVEASEAEIH